MYLSLVFMVSAMTSSWNLFISGTPLFVLVLYLLAFIFTERTDLIFEGNRLIIGSQHFNSISRSQEINVSDIVGVFLERVDGQYRVSFRLRREPSTSNWITRLQKSFKGESYTVQRNLTELESLWLIQEIQDWLSDRA
jgi:hypothetical protein